MSKIGQYIIQQIERGYYETDRQGRYYVYLHNRKPQTTTTVKEDSFRQDEGGTGCNHSTQRQEGTSDNKTKGVSTKQKK